MSNRHYEELWREGVADLVGLLDAEHPEDLAAAPKSLEDWGRLYVRYVQTFRKLCTAHDGVAQPQKRRCLRRTLEACLGRLLELRDWMAVLNGSVDVIDLGEQLAALRLTPDALDLPVPSAFREAREEALAARAQAVAAVLATAVAGEAAGSPPGEAVEEAQLAKAAADGKAAAKGGAEAALPPSQAPLRAEQKQKPAPALAVPEAEEPGTDVQAAFSEAAAHEQRQQQPEQQQADARQHQAPEWPTSAAQQQQQQPSEEDLPGGQGAQRAAAAVVVQAGVRGWLARRHVAAGRRQELEFLGMLPQASSARSAALQQRLAAISAEQKQRQVARQRELDDALAVIKAGVRQREGFAMKEQIRGKLNAWFLKSRDPETGDYADLPEAAKGGSWPIVYPLPPEPSPEEAAAAAARTSKASSSGKPGAGAKSAGKGAAAEEAPQMSRAFVEGLREAVQEYMDVWQEWEEGDPTLALLPPELQGLPQPKGGSGQHGYDAAMATAEVRPVVFEELRLEADDDMRRLIQSIKDMLKAEREGRKKKKGKKGKKGANDKAAKRKAPAAASGDNKGGAATGAKGGKKGGAGAEAGETPAKKKKKDLTACRSIESIFAELAAAGLVRQAGAASVDDFLGSDRLAPEPKPPADLSPAAQPSKPKAGGKKANAAPAAKAPIAPAGRGGAKGKGGAAAEEELKEYPQPSLAQARQAVVASCILPLGAYEALSKLPAPRTVLMYGPAGSGKTLLATAVAHQTGATLFDLSPAAIAGKYPGKQAAIMVHMVFKAARALAPSVVLLEDVEQVFVSDKTRAKALAPPGGEPPNRIKKQLLAEAADLEPGDGVLVLCNSRQPQACVKKDERALRGFIQRYIELPLPDYGGRHTLLKAFAQREGLDVGASLSLLTQLSAGLSSGQLLEFVQQLSKKVKLPILVAGSTRQAGNATGVQESAQGASPVAALLSATARQGTREGPKATAPVLQEVALELLPAFAPVPMQQVQELREWTAKAHSPLPPEEAPKDGKKGAKKK